MKMIIQVFRPAVERACENEKPFSRNRKPKKVATNQKIKCSVPIQTSELVDCENNHATGANPTSRMVININKPQTKPQISDNRACEPLKQVKMYRLGRQISAEKSSPPAIFSGAAQSCIPWENVPATTP